MDAVAYQMSFDKEQLALLCANYDRRIDSLGAENKRLKAENAKLRDENSRLQKYASKALSAISYCDCCPYVDCGCDTETVPMHEGCKAFEELRELGVEVDG